VLTEADLALLRTPELRALYGNADGDALRDVIFSWWEARFLSA
jgi:hypothetical protein